jgi:hypothetical protein
MERNNSEEFQYPKRSFLYRARQFFFKCKIVLAVIAAVILVSTLFRSSPEKGAMTRKPKPSKGSDWPRPRTVYRKVRRTLKKLTGVSKTKRKVARRKKK